MVRRGIEMELPALSGHDPIQELCYDDSVILDYPALAGLLQARKPFQNTEDRGDIGLLPPLLERWLTNVRDAHPEVQVDPKAFIIHVADRLSWEDGAVAGLERMHGADLYLAFAASEGEPTARTHFMHLYRTMMIRAASRVKMAGASSEDIAQQLFEALLLGVNGRPPTVALYAGQGPLSAYVRVAAYHQALKLHGRDNKLPTHSSDEALAFIADTDDDPELRALKDRYGDQFKAAFQEAMGNLESRERNLLRYHYLSGLNTRQISKLTGVNQSTVVRHLSQIRSTLFGQVRQRLMLEFGMGDASLDSVLNLVQSQLDMSIERVLQTKDQ